jgi:hypothetical protein
MAAWQDPYKKALYFTVLQPKLYEVLGEGQFTSGSGGRSLA